MTSNVTEKNILRLTKLHVSTLWTPWIRIVFPRFQLYSSGSAIPGIHYLPLVVGSRLCSAHSGSYSAQHRNQQTLPYARYAENPGSNADTWEIFSFKKQTESEFTAIKNLRH